MRKNMKKCLTTFFSIAICLFVLPVSIFADELLFSDKQRNEIKAAVELWLDGKYKVVSVSGTPVKNLLEVRIGNELVYVDSEGTHILLEGQLIRLSDGKNLTELKKNKILSIDFSTLPVDLAITTEFNIDGNDEPLELAVFEDPNCGYCRKFRKTLSEIKNLKVYTFLYPILGNESIEISKDVWCSSDPSSVWDKLMLQGERPKKSSDLNCDFDQQKEVVALGRKLGIEATPTVFLSNGERLRGAIPLEALKDKLQTISGQER